MPVAFNPFTGNLDFTGGSGVTTEAVETALDGASVSGMTLEDLKLKFGVKQVSGNYEISPADGAVQILSCVNPTTLSFSPDWFGSQAERDAAFAAAGGGDFELLLALGGRKLTLIVGGQGGTDGIAFDETGDGMTVPLVSFVSGRPPSGGISWTLTVDFLAAGILGAYVSEPQSSTTVDVSSEQTLTNKTLGNLAETIYTVVDGVSVDLDPANGPLQQWALGAARSPTAANFANGQRVKLRISGDFIITWPSVVWMGSAVGESGTAPTSPTTGFMHIELWKESGVLYGSLVGYSAT